MYTHRNDVPRCTRNDGVAYANERQVWLKMARIARRAGLLNLARLALERLLGIRGDHILALRTLKDVLLEIGDVAATREVCRSARTKTAFLLMRQPSRAWPNHNKSIHVICDAMSVWRMANTLMPTMDESDTYFLCPISLRGVI